MENGIGIDYSETGGVTEPKEEVKDLDKRKEQPLGDVYDIYGMVSDVHSKITDMSRDYVLANYTSEIINSKFPKFVREQRKTLRIIKSFLEVPEVELEKRYNSDYVKTIKTNIHSIYLDIKSLLLGELDEMTIMSRAGKGKVTDAMLLHGRGREEREEFEREYSEGVKERLMEKSK